MKKESSLMILAVMLTFQSTASVRGYIPIGGWDEAHATYYGGNDASGTNNGACGYGNQLSAGYGTITTALSTPLFEQGKTCGACYELRCFGGEAEGCLYGSPPVIVTATNFCPPGSFGGWCDPPNVHFDLSEPAFSHLARVPVGHVGVGYTRVNCERSGGMRFTINGHTYFNQVLVTNVGGAGDVEQVWIRGSNSGWMPMVRNWGQNWLNEGDMDGQKLSFLVTTSDGRTATSYDVAPPNWQFGQTFSGTQVLSH